MPTLTIELASPDEQTALNLRRWAELLKDRELAKFQGRVETDRHGHVIMIPPASLDHGRFQYGLLRLIESYLPDGLFLVECAISTQDGVRITDAAWVSKARLPEVEGKICLTKAPEICVEVLSPSNSKREMTEKKALYFAAGAKEVWFCDKSRKITFFTGPSSSGEKVSKICPAFPAKIEL